MANSKEFEIFFTRDSLISLKLNTNIISPYDTMLWYRLEDLNRAVGGHQGHSTPMVQVLFKRPDFLC